MAFLAVVAHYNEKTARLALKDDFRELTQLLSGVVIAEITTKVLPDTSVVFLHINTIVCYVKG